MSNNKALIEFAECIELYAHKNRLILRLEMEDYEAALLLCREALHWCQDLLRSSPSGTNQAEHQHNCENLTLLEQKIAEVLHQEQSKRQYETTAH